MDMHPAPPALEGWVASSVGLIGAGYPVHRVSEALGRGRSGRQTLPRNIVLLGGPFHPSSSSSPVASPLPARTGPRPEPGLGVSRQQAPVHLNLLQKVGGEQPHLAAGVDLDVAANFVAFLHYDLGSERVGEQELN